MYEQDLTLDNLQGVISHKAKQNQTKSYIFNIYVWTGFDIR